MGWEDFLESTEKLVATFHHRKKKVMTVIGMTDKRAFLYQKKKTTQERFVSSKAPISYFEYTSKKISILHWIIIGILCAGLLVQGGMMISSYYYSSTIGIMFIVIALLIFLIAFLFRHVAIIRTYIGIELVVLRSRRAVENIVEFVKIIHAEHPIEFEGVASGIGSTLNTKSKRYIRIGIVLILLYFIYTMFLGFLLPF